MTGFGHNSGYTLDDLDGKPGDWIALSRRVREHPIVGLANPVKPADHSRGSCSRFEAWFDLLCLAQWRPSRINNKGQVITLDVGQLMGALPFLADRWNWTVATVRWYLATLEREQMISRAPPKVATSNSQNSRQPTNKCNVITIENYSKYQLLSDAVDAYVQQAKRQASDSRATAEQQANDSNLTSKQPNNNTPPYPPPGGEPEPSAGRKRKRGLTAAQINLTDEAVRLWNATAQALGLSRVQAVTDARRARLVKRLDDIGGLDRFALALSAIERVPFLMGKVPPRPGQAPFKLDIDRLMQTDGNLGDVLAKLIDKAGDETELIGPNGKRWGWWRDKEDDLRALSVDYWRQLDETQKPNGTWPWWVMGAPPGHDECIMPDELVAERGYVEIYKGKISHA